MEDKNVSLNLNGPLRKRKKEPIARPYTQEAADIVSRAITQEYDTEKELGFDVKDRQSVINYNLNYTPIGDNILVKRLKDTALILSDGAQTGKFIVVEVSPEIYRPIIKGDIVTLGGPHMEIVPMANRTLNGIKLIECSVGAVAGLYITKEEYEERFENFKPSSVNEK